MAKKKTSVLNRQRPKKNRKKSGFFRAKSASLLLLAVAGLILAGTVYVLKRPKTTQVAGKTKSWKVSIKSDDRSLLEGKEETAILQAVKTHVTNGEKKDLRRAVESIKADETFAKIHLVRTGMDELTLYYSKRVPVMCYQEEQLYFISAEAEIYGSVESIDSCPGPVVVGLLEDRKKSVRSGVLKLTPDEQKNTSTALQLVKILHYFKHQPTKLTYEKYRGFYVNIKGLETDIALGNPPFETKLEKLDEVLEKIRSKGEVAQRIELDFQGKAFIKLKKM